MKQSLQLSLKQQLKITPQLQQAIKLLQLSSLDLQQEIQSVLESNPMLELDEDSIDENYQNDYSEDNNQPSVQSTEQSLGQSSQEALPDDLSLDSRWEDTYSDYGKNQFNAVDDNNFDYKNTQKASLQDHLHWQLNVTRLVDADRIIATAIIDAVEPAGFLSLSPDDIYQSLVGKLDIDFEDFEAVRHLLQNFDPVGVASADLADCLLVQLQQMPENTPFINDARLIIQRYLPLLASHDYAQLRKRTRFKEGRLTQTVKLIQSLNPQPGLSIDDGSTEYITPDVYVKKQQGQWYVSVNQDCAPKIHINEMYASMVKRADNSRDNQFLKDNLQEARWFLKSLEGRNETLLKVASKIVEHQQGFLEHGEQGMKPLVLSDIAQDIDMHESTISRVTTRKYMHTPRGIFELKYFFSSHVSTDTGGECSSTAIRARIKKLVQEENRKKPLSDNKITSILGDEGIKVARRTVAKYREAMAIAPSNERKRLD